MTRRDYGTGSIVAKGPGRWQIRWYDAPDLVTGERRRRSTTVTGTRRDAARILQSKMAGPAGSDITLAEVIAAWRAQAGHELGTARNYDLAVRTLPQHLIDSPVHSVRPATLAELYRRVELEHGVHRTRTVHALLSGALTHAWRMEWIASNPARRVQPPPQPRRAAAATSSADVAAIVAAVADDPLLHAWLLVSAGTGARRSEVLALRWSHIDLEHGQVFIEGALDPVDGHVKSTKTHGHRPVAVGPQVVEALRRWRLAFLERALAVTGTVVPDPFVFTDTFDGSKPWRPDGATHRFATIRESVGATGVRLHDLRHHAATVLLAAGVEAKTVAARLGHTRVATTTDLYGHAIPARDQAAAAVIEQALGAV
jgi:integrase